MKKVSVIIILIVVFALLPACGAVPIVNNNTAKKIAYELAQLPLPSSTELIETVYKAGKLVGCGNGMQYFGAILIESELSLEELKEYYLQFAGSEWECVVEHQLDADVKIIEHGVLTFKTDIEEENYDIVYSWGHAISHVSGKLSVGFWQFSETFRKKIGISFSFGRCLV